jgi:hypothetical protein
MAAWQLDRDPTPLRYLRGTRDHTDEEVNHGRSERSWTGPHPLRAAWRWGGYVIWNEDAKGRAITQLPTLRDIETFLVEVDPKGLHAVILPPPTIARPVWLRVVPFVRGALSEAPFEAPDP